MAKRLFVPFASIRKGEGEPIMRQWIRRAATAVLAFALLFVLAVPAKAEAAQTEKLTLYQGEAYTWSIYNAKSVSSVTTSKKAVAAVSCNKSKKQYSITAKKPGTANVTIRGKDYYGNTQTKTIKVTVAKAKLDVTVQKLDGSYALLAVKNNTKATFDKVLVRYTLKDAGGAVIAEKEEQVSYAIAGRTAYKRIYVSSIENVDFSQADAAVTAYDRNPDYTYKTLTAKQVVVTAEEAQTSDSKVELKVKKVNKTDQYVHGMVYFLSYDAQGTILDVTEHSIYLDKKETKTGDVTILTSSYSHPDYDHYKMVYQAYYSTKK